MRHMRRPVGACGCSIRLSTLPAPSGSHSAFSTSCCQNMLNQRHCQLGVLISSCVRSMLEAKLNSKEYSKECRWKLAQAEDCCHVGAISNQFLTKEASGGRSGPARLDRSHVKKEMRESLCETVRQPSKPFQACLDRWHGAVVRHWRDLHLLALTRSTLAHDLRRLLK